MKNALLQDLACRLLRTSLREGKASPNSGILHGRDFTQRRRPGIDGTSPALFCLRLCRAGLFLLFCLCCTWSQAWEVTTHLDMGLQSKVKLKMIADAHPEALLCIRAIDTYWYALAFMLVHEDDGSNPEEHFYDPYTGRGLYIWRSALERANQYWESAINNFRLGNYPSAFNELGRVCHLVQDMGCPAHTLLDPHLDETFFPPITGYVADTDSLHIHAQQPGNYVHSTGEAILAGNNLTEVMTTLARISSAWDSDDRCGHDLTGRGNGRLNGLSQFCNLVTPDLNGVIISSDLQLIVSDCMPRTEEAVASVLILFLEKVRPLVVEFAQPAQDKAYNGTKGVPLAAYARIRPPAVVSNIRTIRFDYQDRESVSPDQWLLAKEVTVVNDVAQDRWYNNFNSGNIVLRAVAVDNAGCESPPVNVTIKLDSTPPKIENTRP